MRKSSTESVKKKTPSKISQSKCTIKSTKRSKTPHPRSTSKEKSIDRNKKVENKRKQQEKYNKNISKYSAIKINQHSEKKEQASQTKNKNIHIDEIYNDKSSQSEDSLEYIIQVDRNSRKKSNKGQKSEKKIKFKENCQKNIKIMQNSKIKGNSESRESILKSAKSRKNSADLIKEITKSNISKIIGREQLSLFLDDYQLTLNQRLKLLKSKWGQLQILQKSVNNYSSNQNNSSNTLVIQNQFYVQKITDLQTELKQKENQLRQLNLKLNEPNNEKQVEAVRQNKRLKQQNALLEKQNKILKNKLKELGFL